MTKVLYIGNYYEGTGYGEACRQYILAMNHVGINVVPRPLFLGGPRIDIPEEIKKLEEKDDTNPTHVIQHTLPHFMEYNGKCGRNIGLFAYESSHFNNSIWADKLNILDEVWTICQRQANAAADSGVKFPIFIMPHACDVDKYQKKYEPLYFPQLKNKFVFYWIGEHNQRKNLAAFLRAFHTEFDVDEPVEAVIKANIPGKSDSETSQIVNEDIQSIKHGLKLYRNLGTYKKETLITHRMTDENLLRLHASCDVFVCSSYGEAWCLPAMDALGMGKPVIAHGLDYINKNPKNGWIPNYNQVPVFGANDTFPDLLVSNELWDSVDIKSLQENMRKAYESKKLGTYDEISKNAIDSIYNYSYDKIGNLIKERLDV